MIAFETEAQRQRREKDERDQLDAAQRNEHVLQQNAAITARGLDEDMAKQKIRLAADELDAAAIRGENTKAALGTAKGRVSGLQSEIQQRTGVAKLHEEIADCENELSRISVLEEREKTVQRLLYCRARVEQWPKREAYLKEQLAKAKEEVKQLEAELPTITKLYEAARATWEKVRPKKE